RGRAHVVAARAQAQPDLLQNQPAIVDHHDLAADPGLVAVDAAHDTAPLATMVGALGAISKRVPPAGRSLTVREKPAAESSRTTAESPMPRPDSSLSTCSLAARNEPLGVS